MSYNLTSRQKDAARSLIHLGRTWREEFCVIWHDPDEISDVLDYDPSPPQVSRTDIWALERTGLLICDFLSDSKVRVTLTPKAYEAVDSDFEIPDVSRNTVSILFLAADPTDTSRLRLGEEFREIQEKLKLAKLRDRFRLELPQLSVRPADISQALLDVQPQIVHFSGHGASTGALCFERHSGQTHLVEPRALAALFEQFANQVNCVLLNTCYSETQAKAIAKHIQYVIGMNQAVSDEAAIAFAIGFYQALGAGCTIREAYRLGCVQIGLQGLPEHLTPVLLESGNEAYGLVEKRVGILSSNRLDISERKEIKKFTGKLVANAAQHSAKTVTGYELYLLSNERYLVYVHCIHSLGEWVEARLAGFDTKGMILEEVQRGFPVVASKAGLSPVEVLEVD